MNSAVVLQPPVSPSCAVRRVRISLPCVQGRDPLPEQVVGRCGFFKNGAPVWPSMSMKPGAMERPLTSTTRSAESVSSLPIAATLPCRTATSPRYHVCRCHR